MPPSPSARPTTALETIYRRHQGLVRWVLRARGVPEAALDDHVHDVFLAILRRLPERDPGVPVRAWVAGVARNVSFSHRRTAARQRSRALRLGPPDDPPRPDELLERREAWHALHAFLADLEPEQREVFVMVEVTGMRVSELAAATGMPPNTLHSRLKVARTRFSQRFAAPHEQRAALLQRAREQGRADPQERRRTWGMIAASIEGLPTLPGASGAAGAATKAAWGLGSPSLTAVTLAVGLLGAAAIGGTFRSRVGAETAEASAPGSEAERTIVAATASPVGEPTGEPPVAMSPTPAPASPQGPEGTQPRPRARAVPTSASSPTKAAAPALDTDAELARAVAALRRARDELEGGRARQALAALDEPGVAFGELERDRRRLELDAACQTDDSSRAREAAAALARLGVTGDLEPPCPRDVVD